jgi:hypothetical protein
VLSEATPATAIRQIASLAPSLKEAELRVLTHLTAAACAAQSLSVRASSRAIADATKCGRRNVQYALDALITRGLIAEREGTRTKASAYMLRFLEVAQIGGVTATPPHHENGGGGVDKVASLQRHPGVVTTPPPEPWMREGVGKDHHARTRIDLKPDKEEKLDRVLNANSRQIPRTLLLEFRRLVVHVSAKLGRTYDAPPDVDSMAALVTACDNQTENLHELMRIVHRESRQPGESPMWWVTVALQRFDGIDAKTQAIRRAELKHARRPRIVTADSPTDTQELDTADLQAQILKLALAKGISR